MSGRHIQKRRRRDDGRRARLLLSGGLIALVSAISALTLSSGGATVARAESAATPPKNTSLPSISGTPAVGQTLSASAGSWSGDTPITFAYQWRRCDSNGANCVSVGGASSSTYVVGSSDVGFRMRVRVTATNGAGQSSAESGATSAVATASAPKNTSEPQISGSPVQGQKLTGSNGSWTGTSPISFSLQWVRCPSDGGAPDGGNCTFIQGATSSTYTLTFDDVGKRMRFRVKASNSAGSQTVASNATSSVTASGGAKPKNQQEPAIAGQPVQGSTLSASTGTWSGTTPMTFAYQWVRCPSNGGKSDGSNCAFISGANGASYVLQSADVGRRMRVRVTATNGAGSSTAASNPTSTVAAAPALPPGAIKLPSGKISIPVSSVSLPAQLIIDGIQFSPNPVRSHHDPFTMRVHVSDSRGYVVRDALVFARSTPLVTTTPNEQRTAQDGWLTLQFLPEPDFPVKTGYNVQFFVRARKDGDNLLAGVSARRLVQVATRS
jgi:hypothetical protein